MRRARRWIFAVLMTPSACSNAETVTPRESSSVAAAAVEAKGSRTEPTRRPSTVSGTSLRVAADDGHSLALWAKEPSAPKGAIVLIHGRTWSGRPDFDLQVDGEHRSTMDALVGEGYAAFSIDLRGYGATRRDASGWNTPDRAARDVVHALEFVRTRTKHDQVAVLGWSLGALTAQLVAQRHPELVSDVILFGYPRRHDHVFAAGPPSDAEPARSKTTASAAAEDFIVPGAISQRAIDAFVKAALRHDPVKADWRALEQWNELEPSALNVPTLLIHAERDPYALASAQAQLFSRFGARDRTYVVVAGGDHAAHIENSGARFVHAVVSFLERPRLEN